VTVITGSKGELLVGDESGRAGNPRLAELFKDAPRTGKSPTVFAFPQLVEYLGVAGQPVQGPWPPHQQPRPDPDDVESGPVAIPDPASQPAPPPPTPDARSDSSPDLPDVRP
jgi:hypothetical protein